MKVYGGFVDKDYHSQLQSLLDFVLQTGSPVCSHDSHAPALSVPVDPSSRLCELFVTAVGPYPVRGVFCHRLDSCLVLWQLFMDLQLTPGDKFPLRVNKSGQINQTQVVILFWNNV